MLFVPLLLLERAPGDDTSVAGATTAAVAAPAFDVAAQYRGSPPRVEPVVPDEAENVDGLQATTPVAAEDPTGGAAGATAPTAVEFAPTTTTTTTAPAATSTTSTTTVLSLGKALLSTPLHSHEESGKASWYHFADRSCAHRTLPFGTIVTVTRVSTGAVVTCRVADRGPADTSRVIDLSYDTFALLADTGSGLIDVRLRW